MSSAVKSRRPRMTSARRARDPYSSTRQQRVQDNRSRSVGSEAGASEKTTTTTRMAAAQSRCHTTYRSDDARRRHSDQSDTTTETSCSSGGGGFCSDDFRTTTDGTMSCGTSHNAVLSLQPQTQELFTVSKCPYLLDSGDSLLNLPDDLIREVFRRISLKEIVRMSSLKKSWRSEMQRLIDDDGYSCRWRTWADFVRTVSEVQLSSVASSSMSVEEVSISQRFRDASHSTHISKTSSFTALISDSTFKGRAFQALLRIH